MKRVKIIDRKKPWFQLALVLLLPVFFFAFRLKKDLSTKAGGPRLEDFLITVPSEETPSQSVECELNNDKFAFFVHQNASDDLVSQKILADGFPYCDRQLVSLITSCVTCFKAECVFLDIGSNIGSCAILAGLLGARVLAFEVVKENAALGARNVFANDLRDKVSIFNVGLGNKNEQVALYKLHGNKGHNMVGRFQERLRDEYTHTDGFVVRLDDVIEELENYLGSRKIIHVIMVDAEGYENEILKGAWKALRHFELQTIYFQFSPHLMGFDAAQELLESMDKNSFEIYPEIGDNGGTRGIPLNMDGMITYSHPSGFAFWDFLAKKKGLELPWSPPSCSLVL